MVSEELFLIAHKVRGEPAFDIAHQMLMDGEVAWITTTYGHRAYPWKWWKLDDLADVSDHPHQQPYDVIAYDMAMPPDLPEHFEVSAAPKGKGSGTSGKDLLAKLGLIKHVEPMSRRSW